MAVRLIDIPGQLREPSAELLGRLRELSDRTDVLYLGNGRWAVGRKKPIDVTRGHRVPMGARMALRIRAGDGFAFDEDRWEALKTALLIAQQFDIDIEVDVQGEPDGALVEEYRRFLYTERTGVAVLTPQEEAEMERQAAARRNRRARERDLAKWLWRKSEDGRGTLPRDRVRHSLQQEMMA